MKASAILSVIAVSGTGAAAKRYNSYYGSDNCAYDPTVAAPEAIKLIDSGSWMPLIKTAAGGVGIAYQTADGPYYKPEHPAAADEGLYDLAYEEEGDKWYLAMYEDGRLGWVSKSSNGAEYGRDGYEKYVTTIFAFKCSGRISTYFDEHYLTLEVNDGNEAYYRYEPTPADEARSLYALPLGDEAAADENLDDASIDRRASTKPGRPVKPVRPVRPIKPAKSGVLGAVKTAIGQAPSTTVIGAPAEPVRAPAEPIIPTPTLT